MNQLRSPLVGLGVIAFLGSFILMALPQTQLIAGPVLGIVLALCLLILGGQLQNAKSETASNLVGLCGLVSFAVCFYRLGQMLHWW
ncbi:hypothetical protein ACFSC4_31550 [Deinococcus malanensis]|nr:hypothetical protein [Deinococcus malanensis]